MKRLAVIALLLLSGCATSHVLIGQQRPPINPNFVTLYTDPPAKFEKIAIIETSNQGSWAITEQGKLDVVIARLKEDAALLGANGILLNSFGNQSAGAVGTGNATISGNSAFGTGISASIFQKHGSAIAIYVTE